MSSEPGFIKCPRCGEFDERRLNCKCGYQLTIRGTAQPVAVKKPFLLRVFSSGVRGFIVLLGIVVIVIGVQEFRVGSGSREEPTEIDLADLETGANPVQNHVRLGEHWRLYGDIMYYGKRIDRSPDPKVDWVMYPIVSLKHPLARQGQDEDKLENEKKRTLHDFRVLVLSHEYKSVRQMPTRDRREARIQGLIINSIRSLSDEELKLIQESFPDLDHNKLLILEKDRKPVAVRTAFLLMASGVLVILAMVGLMIWNHRVEKRAPAQPDAA